MKIGSTGTLLPCLLMWMMAMQTMQAGAAGASRSPPNFVILMTDDQGDMLSDTRVQVMPALNEHIIQQGQRFVNFFATTPICCPSRVSIFRGQYAHNTNYTDVIGVAAGGVGGYPKFKELKIDSSYLPTWLQSLGYNTYYTGKFLVDYNVRNYNDTPKGWTDIDALVGPYTFQYYNPVFSRNGMHPQAFPGQYTTDVVADKALAQLVTAARSPKPFYLQISPVAPHFSSGGPVSPNGTVPKDVAVPHYPPLPAPRHWGLFNDMTVPKPLYSFNEEDVSDKPAWIRSLPKLSLGNLTYLEEIYRNRLRALRAVDEMVDRVVDKLDELGLLSNTYIIYTSDNGYHMGTHRRATGKLSSYEEDIHVPLIIRGPGIKPGVINLNQAAHVDIAPTLLALAGANAPPEMDGSPLPFTKHETEPLPPSYPNTDALPASRSQLPFTYYAGGNGDFDEYFNGRSRPRNTNWTWKSLRVLDAASMTRWDSQTHRHFPLQRGYKYSIICSNERELYDLKDDPNELNNLLAPPSSVISPGTNRASLGQSPPTRRPDTIPRLANRLDVLFQVMQTCWGSSCRTPFQFIHNDSSTSVNSLWAALDRRYDELYSKIPRFSFKSCQRYQDYSNEVNAFSDIIGHFPRGPDGRSLAPINITYHPCCEPNPFRARFLRWMQGMTIFPFVTGQGWKTDYDHGATTAQVERYAVPLSKEHLHLPDDVLYGPEGSWAYQA